MKEITDIVHAFAMHQKAGKQTALATVVQLEGSSYRRPGARMLVSEDGQLTGAISGGCLEGDALRKARLAMAQGKPSLVKYDTMDEDDAQLGVGLGCNGIIHILIEPINPAITNHPIALLQQVLAKRQTAVLVTLFSLQDRKADQPGTCLAQLPSGISLASETVPEALSHQLEQDAQTALNQEKSINNIYALAEQSLTAFIEVIHPAPALVICGAGNDAMPLVNMAQLLGWHTAVVDGRANYATAERFPWAQQILVSKPEALLTHLTLDKYTAVVLLTHNYNYDLAALKVLLPHSLPYIGVLGPKKKFNLLLQDLQDAGLKLTDKLLMNLYGPIGLDLGAETPEEIALSILSEIKAVFAQRQGGFLRDKKQSIHAPEGEVVLENPIG
ncbi:alanine dehydrogenase [Rufibacter sp. DG15C]|uniref:XdhC family protein n=1 Tax=Rufibacter sp. DG15C TaxID=1379909 RepID=UPI00078C952B|nr:XdhC/CoxI family protein [Rufibacter sp. DG15C]AMM51928.1 alanine dehydrogenase [Rufibacter sp. DG15C]